MNEKLIEIENKYRNEFQSIFDQYKQDVVPLLQKINELKEIKQNPLARNKIQATSNPKAYKDLSFEKWQGVYKQQDKKVLKKLFGN